MRNRLMTLGWVFTAAFLAGCGARVDGDGMVVPDDLVGDLGEHLTALTNTCVYNTTTKLMTIALTANEVALITREDAGTPLDATDDFLLVNGVDCDVPVPAGTAPVLKISVTTTGTGNETVIFDFTNGTYALGGTSTTTTGITVDLGTGTGDVLGFKFGSTDDPVVYGASGATFDAGTTKDLTAANAEIHKVYLGDGNDSYTGKGSTATGAAFTPTTRIEVLGGAGDDSFDQGTLKTPKEVLSGGSGNDSITYAARTTALTITLSATADATDGEAGTTPEADDLRDDLEIITGGTLADVITGAATTTAMTISGGAGNDVLTGGGAGDTISGDAGNDTISGGAGNDILNGNAGNDTFVDGLTSGLGDDVFNGGAGVDTLNYGSSGGDARVANLDVDLDGVADDGAGAEADNAQTDVENITGGDGNDTLTGSTSNNILIGGLGDDTLAGLAGKDTASYATHTGTVDAILSTATLNGSGSESDSLASDIENLTGGSGDDNLSGDANSNELVGGAGSDTLLGLGGDDVLEGGGPGNTETNILTCGAGEGDIGYGQGTLGTKDATCEF
jgi:Ca2+-binding RTX toxin-like protein